MSEKPLIIANWKASHTEDEVRLWLKEAKEELLKVDTVEIVICPPYIYLPALREEFSGSNVRLGAQDVSIYEKGAYTGEVTARMLSPFCSYCIVGHSERKKYFAEDEKVVGQKIKQVLQAGITPVLCVADQDELERYLSQEKAILDEKRKIVFAYEPPRAISTAGDYHPEDPSEVDQVAAGFRERLGDSRVIYGGSTNPENIASILSQGNIEGVLVGQASWEAKTFLSLIPSRPLP